VRIVVASFSGGRRPGMWLQGGVGCRQNLGLTSAALADEGVTRLTFGSDGAARRADAGERRQAYAVIVKDEVRHGSRVRRSRPRWPTLGHSADRLRRGLTMRSWHSCPPTRWLASCPTPAGPAGDEGPSIATPTTSGRGWPVTRGPCTRVRCPRRLQSHSEGLRDATASLGHGTRVRRNERSLRLAVIR